MLGNVSVSLVRVFDTGLRVLFVAPSQSMPLAERRAKPRQSQDMTEV